MRLDAAQKDDFGKSVMIPIQLLKLTNPIFAMNLFGHSEQNQNLVKLWLKQQIQIEFKFGTHKSYGSLRAKVQVVMLAGIEMRNIGLFGVEKVFILHG